MQRFERRWLILLGISLVLYGLALSLNTEQPARAQGNEDAEYVGLQTCTSCHKEKARIHELSRHGLTLRDVTSDTSAITADFTTGDKERQVKFPNEDAPRAFTADDIAYVIGSGRRVERFLYRVSRSKYMVLPAEWNTAAKIWQPYTRAESWPDPAYDWMQNCAGCHTTGLMPDRGRWTDSGVQCEACHGPGSRHADLAQSAGDNASDSQLKDIRAAIVVSADAQICGQCHSAGTEPDNNYHYPIKYRPGANLLDKTVFKLAADGPDNWWAIGRARHPNMQFNEWLKSGHAKGLTALQNTPNADPACLSCHSADYAITSRLADAQKARTRQSPPPDLPAISAVKNDVTCVSCHDPHLDSSTARTRFDLVSEPYKLCVSCHHDNAVTSGKHHPVQEIYEGLEIVPEVRGVAASHARLSAAPKCQTCHTPTVAVDGSRRVSHVQTSIMTGKIDPNLVRNSCTGCHTNNTPELMQRLVTDTQNSVKTRVKNAKAALKDDSPAWTRTVLEAVEGDGSWGIHNPRYVSSLLGAVEKELGLRK